jgi:thymidylate kinase
MSYLISTIFGLPGAGKSTYCQERAYKGIGSGEGCWRPEPTDDIAQLQKHLHPSTVQSVLIDRFKILDSGINPAAWRDSDVFTSMLTFSSTTLENCDYRVWVPRVSDKLVWLKISPELQRQRIIARGRPDFWRAELEYCDPYWHYHAQKVYDLHPAQYKTTIIVN